MDTGSPIDGLQDGTPSQGSRKRKAPSSGSRGVASLTPDQLAKKRANDREAQRAIRERTKQTIDTLEAKIKDLTSQQPYQELQAVVRQKDVIQAENEEMRRRMASIMGLIQPIIGAQGLTGTYFTIISEHTLTIQDLASAAHHNVQVAQNANAFQQEPYLNGQQRPYQPEAPYQPYGEAQALGDRAWTGSRDALEHQRDNAQRGLEINDSGERLSFNFLLDSIGQRHGQATQKQTHSPDQRSSYPAVAATYADQPQTSWNALPKNVEPTCPLDSLFLNFLAERRRDADSSSAPKSSLSPPTYPSVSSLLNPTAGHRIDPLSQLMADVISKFPNIAALPTQVAVLFAMFVLMRWISNPTQENYERMPEWVTPRPSQLFTPHPVWIDYIPWPRLRDKLVANYQDYPFENWFLPFTSGMNINWPYDDTDCLLSTSDKDDPIINPVFERHIRRLENWSLGPIFAETFPALADTVRIKDQHASKTGDNA